MTKEGDQAPDNRALYRKYRSKSLQEVVGQTHITDLLERSLKQGKIAHAYLLTGPRGVGKTSVARILAHEINQLPYDDDATHLDIIEIDAASNNGVDDVRDLREKAQIAPVAANKKVYIIDEVHMLSKAAFNALLKTLEEPPSHVVFILATTDIHKVPDTILSRVQRFTFRLVSQVDLTNHLRMIANQEKINIEDEALAIIANHGGGSFRDSISLLDQLRSLANGSEIITTELVEKVVGRAPLKELNELLDAYTVGDAKKIIETLDNFEQKGIDGKQIANQLIDALKPRLSADQSWVDVLNALVNALRSPRPDIILLTALLANTSTKRTLKSVATTTAAPELTVLANEATKSKPSEKRIQKKIRQDLAKPPQPPNDEPKLPEAVSVNVKAVAFDWEEYLAYMKEHYVAVHSILVKCKPQPEGEHLKIYTNTMFYKKKLDDSKYQPILYKVLSELNMNNYTIETIPSHPPLKDSQAAAVAAIMGGGEEVSLDDLE